MTIRVSVVYQRDVTHFVSEDGYRIGCRTVSHSQQQSTQDYDHEKDKIFHLLTKTLSVGLSMVIGPENVRSVTQRPTN